MKRLLLDTNIVLDVLLNRQPWMQNSQLLWQHHEKEQCVIFLSQEMISRIMFKPHVQFYRI